MRTVIPFIVFLLSLHSVQAGRVTAHSGPRKSKYRTSHPVIHTQDHHHEKHPSSVHVQAVQPVKPYVENAPQGSAHFQPNQQILPTQVPQVSAHSQALPSPNVQISFAVKPTQVQTNPRASPTLGQQVSVRAQGLPLPQVQVSRALRSTQKPQVSEPFLSLYTSVSEAIAPSEHPKGTQPASAETVGEPFMSSFSDVPTSAPSVANQQASQQSNQRIVVLVQQGQQAPEPKSDNVAASAVPSADSTLGAASSSAAQLPIGQNTDAPIATDATITVQQTSQLPAMLTLPSLMQPVHVKASRSAYFWKQLPGAAAAVSQSAPSAVIDADAVSVTAPKAQFPAEPITLNPSHLASATVLVVRQETAPPEIAQQSTTVQPPTAGESERPPARATIAGGTASQAVFLPSNANKVQLPNQSSALKTSRAQAEAQNLVLVVQPATQPPLDVAQLVALQSNVAKGSERASTASRPSSVKPVVNTSHSQSVVQPQVIQQQAQPGDGKTHTTSLHNTVLHSDLNTLADIKPHDLSGNAESLGAQTNKQQITVVVGNDAAAPATASTESNVPEEKTIGSGTQLTGTKPGKPVEIVVEFVTQKGDNVTTAALPPSSASNLTPASMSADPVLTDKQPIEASLVSSQLAPPAVNQPFSFAIAWTTLVQSASFVLFVKAACMISNVVFQVSPLPQVQAWVSDLSTGDADAAPVVAIAFGGWQWCFYGLFAWLVTQRSGFLILVHSNCLGALLGTYYAVTFSRHCQSTSALVNLSWYFCVAVILAAVQFVSLLSLPVQQALSLSGAIASCCSIATSFSALVTLPTVIRTKRSDSIPGPVVVAGLASAVLWFFCGLMLMDLCILVPNCVSIITGAVCIFFKVKYPSHSNTKAPPQLFLRPARGAAAVWTAEYAIVASGASSPATETVTVLANEEALPLNSPPSFAAPFHAGTGDTF